jgi:serine/alanine adding enzyme
MKIRLLEKTDQDAWDSFVHDHPDSTHCHLIGWKEVIEKTYGHSAYYLLAAQNGKVEGILPLFHMKSLLFGNRLVSLPFMNYGGILGTTAEVEEGLLSEAIILARSLQVTAIELRHISPLSWVKKDGSGCPAPEAEGSNLWRPTVRGEKVRMVLSLPDSERDLFQTFKSKLRSQINRPQKEGMTAVIGGEELLDHFYAVFSTNMRDLGSPVHSRKFFSQMFRVFHPQLKTGIVYSKSNPVAAGIVFCFRKTVEIPWASSLKEYNKQSPNMLLYWSFLEYATRQKAIQFDFGRSTPGEGTYRFKEQWGSRPQPLLWYVWEESTRSSERSTASREKDRVPEFAIFLWSRMPVFLTNRIGPRIRKNISL